MNDIYDIVSMNPCPFCMGKMEVLVEYDPNFGVAGCVNEKCKIDCYVQTPQSFDDPV